MWSVIIPVCKCVLVNVLIVHQNTFPCKIQDMAEGKAVVKCCRDLVLLLPKCFPYEIGSWKEKLISQLCGSVAYWKVWEEYVHYVAEWLPEMAKTEWNFDSYWSNGMEFSSCTQFWFIDRRRHPCKKFLREETGRVFEQLIVTFPLLKDSTDTF